MRGAAELLQEPMAEADRQRFAGNIERQTLRLQALVDKLLNLAEVEQMRQLSNSEPVDLVALTEEAVQALEPRWRLKGLQFSCALGNKPVRVRGDRFLLAQAMRNLIDNAIDFSPQGGRITCTLTRDAGGCVTWSLRDEGTGVPDYALDRVFERFYSLPRSDTQEKSSGLGLCLVKEVSDLHGAQVRVDNVDHPRGCLATWRFPT
jgi:two-component system sensor histidine kinase CreC